jgi:hypothetical protein
MCRLYNLQARVEEEDEVRRWQTGEDTQGCMYMVCVVVVVVVVAGRWWW